MEVERRHDGKIGLVACCKAKLRDRAAAKDLYVSQLFRLARVVAEHHERWFILSAKYGLVSPDRLLDPYDWSMSDMRKSEKESWGLRVMEELKQLGHLDREFVAYAGEQYLRPLSNRLRIERPLQGVAIGKQLAWLKRRIEELTRVNDGDEAAR